MTDNPFKPLGPLNSYGSKDLKVLMLTSTAGLSGVQASTASGLFSHKHGDYHGGHTVTPDRCVLMGTNSKIKI